MTGLQVEALDKRIRRVLLDRILSGALRPGANLNEARLAEELEVSRTPMRQALARLEQDGFLYTRPNRGFFVSALSAEQARELYPILAALECAALRSAPPNGDDLPRLHRLNEEFAAGDPWDAEESVGANSAWHEALLFRSRNERLRDLLETIRQQVYRYEISFFSPGPERLEKSVRLHRSILAALETRDIDEASRRLEAHWMADLDQLAPAAAVPDEPTPEDRKS